MLDLEEMSLVGGEPPISIDEAVLLAIGEGAGSIGSIATKLNIDRKTVAESVSRLHSLGLVNVEERGFIFFRYRRLVLTDRGFREFSRVRSKINEWVKGLGDRSGEAIRELAVDYPFILPVLYMLGFMALTSDTLTFEDFDADVDVA